MITVLPTVEHVATNSKGEKSNHEKHASYESTSIETALLGSNNRSASTSVSQQAVGLVSINASRNISTIAPTTTWCCHASCACLKDSTKLLQFVDAPEGQACVVGMQETVSEHHWQVGSSRHISQYLCAPQLTQVCAIMLQLLKLASTQEPPLSSHHTQPFRLLH